MNVFCRARTVLLCLSGISLAAVAQQPTSSATSAAPTTTVAQTAPMGSNDHPVMLDVLVTDRSGKPVQGLREQDFTVLDDQQPSPIVSFRALSGPADNSNPETRTEIVLILDEVNTSYLNVSYELDEVKRFLGQNKGQLAHPVSLGFFTDKGLELQTTPALDGNAIIAALEQHQHGLRSSSVGEGSGLYGAEDRTRLSLDAMHSLVAKERLRTARKMVIWISPGWPLLSGTHRDLTQGQMQSIFHSVVQMSTDLRQARITMYSIDPTRGASAGVRTTFYENFTKGLTDPKHAEVGDLGLAVLATQSGGRAIFGNNSITSSLERCVEDLNAYYEVSIEAPAADHADAFHSLGVKLAEPGLAARTWHGYYAQP
jgi:VWFA-related protein